MEADATLDTFGLLCPMPIIRTAEKMKELKVGEVLEVLATGNEYLGLEEREGEYRVYLRKLRE